MNTFPWLTVIIVFPVLAGLLIPFFPQRGNHLVRWYTLGICLLDFLLMTYVFHSFYNLDSINIQLKDDFSWIEVIDFHWRVGLDGLSVSLFLLTGFVTSIATLAAWPITRNPKLFYFLMLAMYSGQLGLFAAQDLLLFFVMWELELIPIYLLLCLWGGKRRLYAATKFILYTAGGSIFLLAASLTLSLWNTSTPILDFKILADQNYPLNIQVITYIGFLIAYTVKLPALPLHTWLPDTHGEAHYSTCMLLAGILLKMGAYGFIRINMELLSNAHITFAPWLTLLGAIQIIYAALVSFAQKNLKRRIAYSSVSHMGFILVGTGVLSELALSGALLQMISHGLIGAGLFFLAGTSYDRTRTIILPEMGGWAASMPKMFAMLTLCSMASLALPGMSGFVAEVMIFFGVITTTSYSIGFRLLITCLESLGIVLTPIYLLSMLRQMFYGAKSSSLSLYNHDASPREVFVLFSLLLPILGIGLYPNLILGLWNDKVHDLANKSPHRIEYSRVYSGKELFLLEH